MHIHVQILYLYIKCSPQQEGPIMANNGAPVLVSARSCPRVATGHEARPWTKRSLGPAPLPNEFGERQVVAGKMWLQPVISFNNL